MGNLLEREVRELHRSLLTRHASFCHCSQCADDVVSFALNHLRPRYATSTRGWALAKLDLASDQTRAELAVVVFNAMQRVATAPRHGPGGSVAPPPETPRRGPPTA